MKPKAAIKSIAAVAMVAARVEVVPPSGPAAAFVRIVIPSVNG